MKTECAFCSSEVVGRAIETGRVSFVLLSSPRLARGHLLVIPKRHVQTFAELTPDEITEMTAFLAIYQKKVGEKIAAGTEIRQNYRPDKKDTRTHLSHFHFNLIPRSTGDEFEAGDSQRRLLYQDLSEVEKKEIINLLG
ncbi:MAG TPA: HIT family protein [Patescibacteria group bacterium]|nr:HIT family protein [Patescibacteria group bacterium]